MTIHRRPLSFVPKRSSSISANTTEKYEQLGGFRGACPPPTCEGDLPPELDRNNIKSNATTARAISDGDYISLRSEVYCMQLQNAEMLEVIRQQLEFLDVDSKPSRAQEATTIDIRKHNPDYVLRRLVTRLVLNVMQRTISLVLRRCIVSWRCTVATLKFHCAASSVRGTQKVIVRHRRLQLRTSWAHWKQRVTLTTIAVDVLSRAFRRMNRAAKAVLFARWRENIRSHNAKKAMAANIIRRILSSFESRRTQSHLTIWKVATILFKQRYDQSRLHAVGVVVQLARRNLLSLQRRAITAWLVKTIMEGIMELESRRYRGMTFFLLILLSKRLVTLMCVWNRWKYSCVTNPEPQPERTLIASQGAKAMGRLLYTSFVHLCASAWYRWVGRVERAREVSRVIAKTYNRSRHTRLLVAFQAWKLLPTSVHKLQLEQAFYKLSYVQQHIVLRFKARQFRRWKSLVTVSMKALLRVLRIKLSQWSTACVSHCFRRWHDYTSRRSSCTIINEHLVRDRTPKRDYTLQAGCFSHWNATTARVKRARRPFNGASTGPPRDLEIELCVQSLDAYKLLSHSKAASAQCILFHVRRLLDRRILLSTHRRFHRWRTLRKQSLRSCKLPTLRRICNVTRMWILDCIRRSFHRWLSAATRMRQCTEIIILTIKGVFCRWALKVKFSAFQHWCTRCPPSSMILPIAYHFASAMTRWASMRKLLSFEKWLSLLIGNETWAPCCVQGNIHWRKLVAMREMSPAQVLSHYSRRSLLRRRLSRWRENLKVTLENVDATKPIYDDSSNAKSAPRGKLATLLFRKLQQIRLMKGFYIWRGAVQKSQLQSLAEVRALCRHIYDMAVKAHEESLARERNTLVHAAFCLRATSLLHSVCTRRTSSQHGVSLSFLTWRVASLQCALQASALGDKPSC